MTFIDNTYLEKQIKIAYKRSDIFIGIIFCAVLCIILIGSIFG